jgi:uncharacterized protein (TIGR03790 family)
MPLRWIALSLLVLAVATASCGRESAQPADSGDAAPQVVAQGLPGLAELPELPRTRAVSVADYDLLTDAPVLLSPGATLDAGILTLDASVEAAGLSVAVLGLGGIPTDGSILPQSVTIAKSSDLAWVALANYATGHWDVAAIASSGIELQIALEQDCVSPGGTFYVALIGYPTAINPDGEASFDSIVLTTSGALPGSPTAVLNQLTPAVAGHAIQFSAAGSTGGDGVIETLTYRWDDGSPDTVIADPDEVVTHVYAIAGQYAPTVTVRNDLDRESTSPLSLVEVAQPNREVLVIYNSSIPESADLADYYMSAATGRGIDVGYKLGLPLADSASFTPDIDRTPAAGVDFEEDILTPIRGFLDDPANAGVVENARYLLLMKGVPHQIRGVEDFSGTLTNTTCSAVDSELCLLHSYGQWPIGGYVWNADTYENFVEGDAGSFMWARNASFSPGQFKTRDIDGGTHDLDYLVGRIDAYTYAEAKQIIDRALAADTGDERWVILDSIESRRTLDTMVDPVWPYTQDAAALSGLELLEAAGVDVFADVTAATIDAGDAGLLPASFTNAVIGYAGWGVNHGGEGWPSGAEYILTDLDWNYLPGACWVSYESFNGTAFSEPVNRRGQGQIADFLRMGGTCAIGNVYEPYTIGVGDERWVLDRYVNHGDRWIEAAYKGLRLLSWQEVVVGDPLCRVK